MKYFITGIFLMITSFASAQIVNIPDPDFKAALISNGVDLNGNGQIELSEALARTNLNITGTGLIQDLTGIEAFENLDSIYMYNFAFVNLDFGNNPNMKYVSFTAFIGNTINISGFTNLQKMDLVGVQYPAGGPELNLIVGHLPRLKSIYAKGSYFGPLDLTGCDSLQILHAEPDYGYGFARPLNITGLTQLDSVNYFLTDGLIATNCTGLKVFYAPNMLTMFGSYIDFAGCTNLREITLSTFYTNIHSIDLSTCSSLKKLKILDCWSITELNLKTGHFLDSLYLTDMSSPPNNYINICVDDFTEDSISNMLQRTWAPWGGGRTLNLNPNCLPSGPFNTTQGKIRTDLNTNGCDNADAPFVDLPVRVTNNSGQSVVHYSNSLGDYADYRYADTLTLTPYLANPYYSISPTSATVNFATANSTVTTADFCATPIGTHDELQITMLPITATRAGTPSVYKLIYKNTGTTTLSGDVQLIFDLAKMNFISASPAVSSQNAGELNWNYTNLIPFEQRSIDIVFNLLPPPVNNINDTVYYMATINPIANDETPVNNSFVLPQRVIGSYDPNDKECLEGSKLDIANIGKPLDYIIRFQNLGNDTAFNIVVVDTLSDKLDLNSIQITSTSHPCDVKQTNGKLEFLFKDIKLPYQAINDAGSHGYVAFKIKTKNSLVIGDSVNNKAAIYFDFNPPVITNIATTIVSPASSNPVKLEYFSLTTKNETNLLTWKAPSTTGTTSFGIEKSNDGIHFNNFGNITASVDRCQLPFNFTDEKPFDGKTYYRLNIKDADGISFYSKVLVAGRTKSGLSINAVVSDKNNTTIYLNASKEQNLQMKIIAADGRLMYNQSKTIEAGNSTVSLQLKNLATGIYTLIVYTAEGEMTTRRFVK